MAQIPRLFYIWGDLFRGGRTQAENPLQSAMKDSLLFNRLTDAELKYLSNFVYERTYEKGEPVFRQGDRGFGLYIIVNGTVAIRSQTAKGEVDITTLEKGSFFGELSLIDEDNIRSATALPLERSTLIGFFKADLMEILERKPEMGVKILLQLSIVLGKRLLETTERIPETILHENSG